MEGAPCTLLRRSLYRRICTRAPPFTRFSPLLARYFLLLFPSLSSIRVDSVSSIRFLVFVTVEGDPIAREFARRE